MTPGRNTTGERDRRRVGLDHVGRYLRASKHYVEGSGRDACRVEDFLEGKPTPFLECLASLLNRLLDISPGRRSKSANYFSVGWVDRLKPRPCLSLGQ